jgi:hypothetical protein
MFFSYCTTALASGKPSLSDGLRFLEYPWKTNLEVLWGGLV